MHDAITQKVCFSLSRLVEIGTFNKVDAPIMRRPVIHTNKCGSFQLLGQCVEPDEIYHQFKK